MFAKEGYPAWPARNTGQSTSGKYSVFYGTFETAAPQEVRAMAHTQENREKFEGHPYEEEGVQ